MATVGCEMLRHQHAMGRGGVLARSIAINYVHTDYNSDVNINMPAPSTVQRLQLIDQSIWVCWHDSAKYRNEGHTEEFVQVGDFKNRIFRTKNWQMVKKNSWKQDNAFSARQKQTGDSDRSLGRTSYNCFCIVHYCAYPWEHSFCAN